MNSRKV